MGWTRTHVQHLERARGLGLFVGGGEYRSGMFPLGLKRMMKVRGGGANTQTSSVLILEVLLRSSDPAS